MSKKQSKISRVMKSYRLEVATIKALEKKANELQCDQTWLVEAILATSLGIRQPTKPLRVVQVEAIAL
jgi:hypothetical protein